MNGYLTTAEAARELKMSQGRVRKLCRAGRFKDAVKVNGHWFVPPMRYIDPILPKGLRKTNREIIAQILENKEIEVLAAKS